MRLPILAGRIGCWLAAAGLAVAQQPSEAPETPRPTILVESVEVQAYYLCDGYDGYGDASFYDCAQRFFRDGERPADETSLAGTWRCVSAVNGPTANHEQVVRIAHVEKGTSDLLLVQKAFGRVPSAKRMLRAYTERAPVNFVRGASLVGAIDRGPDDWVSTPWAYVQVAEPLRYFSGGGPEFHETRAAFRFDDGRLLIEHAATEAERERMWETLTADPRSTDARERIRDLHERGEVPTVADAIQLADELVNDEIYRDGNPFLTAWTERSLKDAVTVAAYPGTDERGSRWSFPIAYSECRRTRSR